MPSNNSDVNQTLDTINLPDESQGVENPPVPPAPEVPPLEVPGRTDTPEHIPEKGAWTK